MTEDARTVGQVCLGWWSRWVDRDDGPARAAMAGLRRVWSPLDAALIPAVHDLNGQLAAAGHDVHRRADRLALIATALAICTHTPRQAAATVFGTPADRPPVTALRFNGLVRETDPDRLRRPLLRALGQVKGGVDVAALGQDLFHWGEAVRTRWAFEYYGAGVAAPRLELENQG